MDGTITQIKVQDGEMAHRGQTLARVFDPSDPIVQVRAAPRHSATSSRPATPSR